jgi:hypothetical protein
MTINIISSCVMRTSVRERLNWVDSLTEEEFCVKRDLCCEDFGSSRKLKQNLATS